MKIGHGDLIHGCGLQAVGMVEVPVLGDQHLVEIDNGTELHRIIGHGEVAVVAESAQLEIVAALQAMGSLPDKQGKILLSSHYLVKISNIKIFNMYEHVRVFFSGEKRSDRSLQKEGVQCNRTRNSYRRKGVGTSDWMGREQKRCTLQCQRP